MLFALRSCLIVILIILSVPLVAQLDGREVILRQAEGLYTSGLSGRAAELYLSVLHGESGEVIPDSLTGLAYHKLGLIAYDAYDDSLAVAYYQRAIDVRDRVFGGAHNQRAHTRAYLATSLRFLDSLLPAARHARQAVAVFEAVGAEVDTLNYIRSLVELASVANRLRDKQLATNAADRAIRLLRKYNAEAADAFHAYYTLSSILLRFDELAAALSSARRALDLGKQMEDRTAAADGHNLLANIQRELGRNSDAYQNFTAALKALEGEPGAEYARAVISVNLAEHYGDIGNYERADYFNLEARRLYATAGVPEEYAAAEKYPLHLNEMGRSAEALALTDEKLTFYGGRLPPDNIVAWAENNRADIITRTNLMEVRARITDSLRRPREALAAYHEVLELQDYLRDHVNTYDSRSYLSGNLRPNFDRAVALHHGEYIRTRDTAHLWSALLLSERARAYSLLTRLKTLSEDERIDALGNRIAQLERRVARGDSTAGAELTTAWLRMDRLRDSTAQQGVGTDRLSRTAIVDYLAKTESTLLEYHLGKALGLVFMVDPEGGIGAFEIDDPAGLGRRLRRWRASIEGGHYRKKSLRPVSEQDSLDAIFIRDGLALTDQLLPAGFREALHRRPRPIIVPDGVLHYLPFAALPLDSVAPPIDYGSLRYLQGTEMGYAYSMGVLLETTRERSKEYAYDVVAFAPTFAGGRGLRKLAHNEAEVNALDELVPHVKIYAGEAASRRQFVEALGGGRVLHLSSHGSVHPEWPNLSYVAFSQLADSTDRQQMLYFNDLRNLRLDNELTVLSACETSLGGLAPGETTLSFASALASAGARSTLTTLWKVDDRATKDLMVDFYRELVDGRGRFAALHAAQAARRQTEDYAHPYYWSGVVLYGPPGGIAFSKEPLGEFALPWWGYGVAGVLLFGMVGYFFYVVRPGSGDFSRLA